MTPAAAEKETNLILLATGCFSALLGSLTIAGWYLHRLPLIQIIPGSSVMTFNTGLCFTLAGVALLAMARERPRITRFCGVVAAIAGALTLFEYATGWDLGIDQLFVTAWTTIGVSNPGRMAVNTAVAFLFTGAGLALVSTPNALRGYRPLAVGIAGCITLALGGTPLLGDVLGIETAFALGPALMAVHTAVGLCVVGVGIIAFAWIDGRDREGTAPRWLPALIAVAGLTTTVFIWHALRVEGRNHLERAVRTEAEMLAGALQMQTASRLQGLSRMAAHWEATTPRVAEMEVLGNLAFDYRDLQAVGWVDTEGIIRWVAPANVGNKALIGKPVRFDVRRQSAFDAAVRQHRLSATRSIDLMQGGRGFWVCVPLQTRGTFSGYLLAVFRYGDLLGSIVPPLLSDRYNAAIYEGDEKIYGQENGEYSGKASDAPAEMYGVDWRVRVWPTPALAAQLQSPLKGLVLFAGLLMTGLLSWTVFLFQTAGRRALLLRRANAELETHIQERTRAEEALRQSQQQLGRYAAELKRSNKELEQFAYVASHDLQEPLRMVRSYTELLERRYGDRLDADARDFMHYAADGAGRMQVLINDLLAYSRVSTRGKQPLPTDAEAALDDAIENLGVAIAESGARISRDPLPGVLADRTQLTQLFQNLIGNAIKFRGASSPSIRVGATLQGDFVLFSVSDDGIGIDPHYSERIFEIFQRLHTRSEYPGTGIGLAVCKKIIERHGGRIWVESEPGKGSTFFFTLPPAARRAAAS